MAASVCIGGAIEGAMLGCVLSPDGTLFPEMPAGSTSADPLGLVGVPLGSGCVVGAVIGLVAGLAAGMALGLPLAILLGALPDEG